MSNDLKLSPKYGVNPTISACFFCGEDKGIALMGHIHEKDEKGRSIRGSDVEAPRRMVFDYEPCDKCKKKMAQGITIVEVNPPTGAFNVITKESFERVFRDLIGEDNYKNVLKRGMMLLDSSVYKEIFRKVEER